MKMKLLGTKTIAIGTIAAVAATIIYNLKKGIKMPGPCSFDLEEMADNASEKSKIETVGPYPADNKED